MERGLSPLDKDFESSQTVAPEIGFGERIYRERSFPSRCLCAQQTHTCNKVGYTARR